MYLTNNLLSNHSYSGVGPDWLMTAMPIFKYRSCITLRRNWLSLETTDESITIDAQKYFSSEKAKSFRAAYTGARLLINLYDNKNIKNRINLFLLKRFSEKPNLH